METEQRLQHIDAHSIGPNRVSFPFFRVAQPEARGPSLSETCSSIQHLLSNSSDSQLSIEGLGPTLLGAGFLYHISSSTGLVSKLTDFLSSPSYILVQLSPSCGRHNRTHSTRPRSRLYSDIPCADQPFNYIGVFPILAARPGRRSIYNTQSDLSLSLSRTLSLSLSPSLSICIYT